MKERGAGGLSLQRALFRKHKVVRRCQGLSNVPCFCRCDLLAQLGSCSHDLHRLPEGGDYFCCIESVKRWTFGNFSLAVLWVSESTWCSHCPCTCVAAVISCQFHANGTVGGRHEQGLNGWKGRVWWKLGKVFASLYGVELGSWSLVNLSMERGRSDLTVEEEMHVFSLSLGLIQIFEPLHSLWQTLSN